MKSLKEVYGIKDNKVKKLNSRQLRSIIEEELRLMEDANPDLVDPERFPLKLSQAAKKAGEEAERLVTGGGEDGEDGDDVVNAEGGGGPVRDLKPSQSSMDIKKACQFALCALMKVEPFPAGPGGDLGAIITNDRHIMDGHHRWVATGMIDPSESVEGFVVEFPAKKMIAALNMITVAIAQTTGKKGSGGFDQFNEAGILPQLQALSKDGFWGGDAEKCLAAMEEWTGQEGDAAVSASAKKMAENVSELTLAVPDDFPARPDMPVISKKAGHLAQAIDLLRQGKVDLNEPYAEDKTDDDAPTNESRTRNNKDKLVMERWRRLAGLL